MRRLKFIYLNSTFYIFFFLFSLVAIPVLSLFVALCVATLPQRRAMMRLRRAISWYGAVVIRILPFPLVRLHYKEYGQSDRIGPCIFICNHRSASDPFLMAVLPLEIVQVVNVWPFRIPVLGVIAKLAEYSNVREMPFEEFLSKSTRLLQEGVSIVAFPEGTRSRDKTLGQFHGAIFRVALEAKAPIVPLCITGNEKIPPVGSAFLHPGIIKIHRLKPLLWEEYGKLNPFKLKNYVRQIINDEIAAMERGI